MTERKYTISDAVLQQRREAAKRPRPSRKGFVSNWKHGLGSTTIDSKMKRCVSTCQMHPCDYIKDGSTRSGKLCLRKPFASECYEALLRAVNDGEYDSLNKIGLLLVAESYNVIRELLGAIQTQGVTRETADGIKLHPSLLVLPKLLGDLGLSPGEWLLTPRSKARADADEKTTITIANIMSGLASRGIGESHPPESLDNQENPGD